MKHISNDDFTYIDTVIKFDEEIKVEFENKKEYFKDTMQSEMNNERIVTEYTKVLLERCVQSIKCNIDYYLGDRGEKIVFL